SGSTSECQGRGSSSSGAEPGRAQASATASTSLLNRTSRTSRTSWVTVRSATTKPSGSSCRIRAGQALDQDGDRACPLLPVFRDLPILLRFSPRAERRLVRKRHEHDLVSVPPAF